MTGATKLTDLPGLIEAQSAPTPLLFRPGLGLLGSFLPHFLDLFPPDQSVGCLDRDTELGDDLSVCFVGVETFGQFVPDGACDEFPHEFLIDAGLG